MLFDQPSAAESSTPLLASLPVTGRLDGLIVISRGLDDEVAVRLTGLPTVLIDVRHPGFDSIHTDDTLGGRMVAEHLLERGHHRFGFLGEAQESDQYVSPSQRRLDGFRTALGGRELDVRLVRHRARDAFAAARELLSGPDRPTAIFAADDTLAAGVLRAARDLDLTVPADVAIAGFDDGELAELIGLTTIRQPLEESGRAAIERLIHQLDRRTTPHEVTLALELIVRNTT